MTEDGKPPSPGEIFRKWVYSRFGVNWGFVVLILLVAASYAFMNWDKVKTWPGVIYATRERIPSADHNRFSVLIAHLEKDTNHEHELLIVEALKEIEGIQVLSLDRTIPLKGAVPEEMEKRGHEEARNYLRKSGASVIIWGMILKRGSSTAYKLYYTGSKGWERKPERYAAPRAETQFSLPELFWSDLTKVLLLLVASDYNEFLAQEGQYVADHLLPFIVRVRKLLETSANRPGWDTDAMVNTRLILADTLYMFGEQSGKNEPIEEAVISYREVLKEFTREKVPLRWAMTQNSLGTALTSMGNRKGSTSQIEEAVVVLREALKVLIQDKVPLDWARTQGNLGVALSSLGEREDSTSHLEEAVIAYREALKEFTRERAPLDWAGSKNNLGIALSSLGAREDSTSHLKEAVVAYREALKEYTQERVPLLWAMTQHNLATTLSRLGEMESNTGLIEEAVLACREALKEYTRERVPLLWASTQHNLAYALSLLGERESGTARLEEAVTAYREALKEHTRERVPLGWAVVQHDLGTALTSLGEREGSTSHLKEAAVAYKLALEVFEDKQATHFVNNTKGGLQRAESLLQERLRIK